MSVQITNEGASIGITNSGVKKFIQKTGVKISSVGATVRITDINEVNEYAYADVTVPASANIADFLQQIEAFLETGTPLATGASTEAKQDTGNTSLASIDTKLSAQATAANQLANSTLTGAVTEIAPATDTASSGLNGRLQRIAQRLSTMLAGLSSVPVDGNKATYSASITGLVLVTGATDFFTITGSASKVVKITRLSITGTRTVSANSNIQLLRRSTANSGGTSTNPAVVAHDSTNAAGTAVVRAYTANPTVGTLVGIVRTIKSFINTPSFGASDRLYLEAIRPAQAFTLRGVAEVLAVNFNADAITGASFNCDIEWSEE